MTGIIIIGRAIFVKDEDGSDALTETYRAEVDLQHYSLKVDKTLTPPYYEIFREWKDGKRILHERVFATSCRDTLLLCGLFYADNPKLVAE